MFQTLKTIDGQDIGINPFLSRSISAIVFNGKNMHCNQHFWEHVTVMNFKVSNCMVVLAVMI